MKSKSPRLSAKESHELAKLVHQLGAKEVLLILKEKTKNFATVLEKNHA